MKNNKKHKLKIIGIIILIFSPVIGYVVYYFYFRPDPAKEAKEAAAQFIKFNEDRINRLIKDDSIFLASFDSFAFKSANEAQDKWQEVKAGDVETTGRFFDSLNLAKIDLQKKFNSAQNKTFVSVYAHAIDSDVSPDIDKLNHLESIIRRKISQTNDRIYAESNSINESSGAKMAASNNRGDTKISRLVKSVDIQKAIDPDMALRGKNLFQINCNACHQLTTQKLIGPGLKGVTKIRTPE